MKRRRSDEPAALERGDARYPEPDDGDDAPGGAAASGGAAAGQPGDDGSGPRLWPRITARLVDFVVLQIVTTPIAMVSGSVAPFIVFTIVVGVYEVATTSVWGQTGGKWLVGLRVVDRATDRPPSVLRSFLRWAVLLYWFRYYDVRLIWVVVVLTLMCVGARRGPHELVSRTVVRTVQPGRIRRGANAA